MRGIPLRVFPQCFTREKRAIRRWYRRANGNGFAITARWWNQKDADGGGRQVFSMGVARQAISAYRRIGK
jgi:hypothetical protein